MHAFFNVFCYISNDGLGVAHMKGVHGKLSYSNSHYQPWNVTLLSFYQLKNVTLLT